ncbi:glycerol-3-phosphate acyltransferase 3 isoform X1 [Coccinella septempunctata]|uniref:glycerol-3-phosphate acyltransferase 3 isoform X1 n=1 Tax=Coccinella septempunctata TaxID=41139 RepID=UPI001D063C7F|nr:glycerol-3-phosphate acyltransferase 3 isoform X1 [Coccinella septempunctata]
MWILSTLSFLVSVLITPFLTTLLCIIFLAAIGKSIGVRRLYVRILLMIFEYGRQNIESAQNGRKLEEESDDEGYSESTNNTPVDEVDSNKHNGTHKNGYIPNSNPLISRDLILVPEPPTPAKKSEKLVEKSPDNEISEKEEFKDFDLSSVVDYIKVGVEAIIEDEVTSRFEAEELKNWNLLIRTNRHYEFISLKLTILWICGFFLRYFFLFPLRVLICCFGILWMLISTYLLGKLPEGAVKRWVNKRVYIIAFRIFARSFIGYINIHNKQYRPANASVCVANHTTPMDVVILSTDNCFSLIGQSHGGFLGLLQRALARASPHIWFERSEVRDRHAVANKLKEHVSNPNNPPILIFPEGTCINNTSVMQFKKGSFEVESVIYPVAIKYDPRFGDAFWNSSRYSMLQYLYMMMTSWAIVCDVWYLPPMHRKEGETAIDFANRVKSVIAKQGGLVDLVWDGQLKRMKPKKEWRERQQEEFSKRLKSE